MIKILIADDENDLRKLLQDQLVEAGYSVIEASDGKEAYEAFENENPDMAIIDIMMPFMDGLSLLSKIRENSNMPVILLTARGDEIDKVSGLRLGADDYIVKPWGMNELLARIEVQKRHLNIETAKQSVIVSGNLWMDFSNGVVKNNGEIIYLNAKEYLILEFFARNMGKVLTKKQIYQEVWKEEYMYDDNTIMVQISHLRAKINDEEHKHIETLIGIGYRFR
ncbi:MAG: response regulator transcription factor [Lachnospiraceae bacterium]|nr:response regulator transcription factor [Lachnospiraceae bacterium]